MRMSILTAIICRSTPDKWVESGWWGARTHVGRVRVFFLHLFRSLPYNTTVARPDSAEPRRNATILEISVVHRDARLSLGPVVLLPVMGPLKVKVKG